MLAAVLGAAAFALLRDPGPAAHSQQPDLEAIARAFLAQHDAPAGVQAEALDLVEIKESQGAHHVRFQQSIDGVPVFGARATVSIAKATSEVSFALDRRLALEVASAAGSEGDPAGAIVAAQRALGIAELRGSALASFVYYPVDGTAIPAWKVLLPSLRPFGSWLIVVRADDEAVLVTQSLLRFDSGNVFDPNPVVTSGGDVPPPEDCDHGLRETALAPQYRTKTLLGIEPGQGKLKGEYVDLTAPGILGSTRRAGRADEPEHIYEYRCNDDRFEEMMVYYHSDATQRHIQSLGFTGESSILARPVPAHAHFYIPGDVDTWCNAFYDTLNQGMHFGDGGDGEDCPSTDIAEDGDVVIHEYGHAIQDDQVPGWGDEFYDPPLQQTWALGEGFADFLAGAIGGDACLGEWATFGNLACDGQPGLRWLQNEAAFPRVITNCTFEYLGIEDPHCIGEVWSGALWDLVASLGGDQAARDQVLTLMLQSHFYLDQQANLAENADAVLQADQDLFGGEHAALIEDVFAARGLEHVALGNADCLGTVNAIDALVVLQLSAELLYGLVCADKADVNDDGAIGAVDSALILQYSAGLLRRL
jgi:Zn-dependent metalloprotease